jgi:hypothetical protein
MDNSGSIPLQVPGFGSMPIFHELDPDECFNDGSSWATQRPRVTVRELAMISHMECLTDKPDWNIQVFDEELIAIWREDALAVPLISIKAWDWCVAELRDKANAFNKSGRKSVRVLDVGSCVCKSDTLVHSALSDKFKEACTPLLAQSKAMDWQANLNSQVLTLVDPSLTPLVYGKTRVMMDGGQVGLKDCIEFCGKGEAAPTHPDERLDPNTRRRNEDRLGLPFCHYLEADLFRWSTRFQWLPCEAKFSQESGTDVHISSYINNLNPVHHESLYQALGKLISLAIDPWNHCLVKGANCRVPMRIRTYGYELKPELPQWYHNFSEKIINFWSEGETTMETRSEAYNELSAKIKTFLLLPEPGGNNVEQLDDDWEEEIQWLVKEKIERLSSWVHPEPGTAFSYDDWKAGKNGKAIVNANKHTESKKGQDFNPGLDHPLYTVALQDTFRQQGLQVVIKIGSIELTPDQPSYAGGDWNLEGQRNEHIVATAMLYFNVENVTDMRLSFRQGTFMDLEESWGSHYGESGDFAPRNIDPAEALGGVFGFEKVDESENIHAIICPGTQEVGSVSTPQGRLLAWPNTLQHRAGPFTLADQSRPGHRRFVVLYLVDPHYRVCSTANVPPQQHDWWAEAALAKGVFDPSALLSRIQINEVDAADSASARARVPQEVVGLVAEATGLWPVGMYEAREIRLGVERDRELAFKAIGQYLPDIKVGIHELLQLYGSSE